MHILHINSYYIGSPFYKNLYDRQIKKLNIDVYVPVSAKHKNIDNDMGEYSKKDVTFTELDRAFFFKKHRKIFKAIKKEYELKNYDILQAHSLFSNGYIAYLINKEYNIPYVVAIRNTDVNIFFKKMRHLRKLGVEIMSNASKIIFISEAYKKEVLNKYVSEEKRHDISAKVEVVPNGIDDFWINNKNHSLDGEDTEEKIRILCVGDIEKNKNQNKTVLACQLLEDSKKQVIFNIVGKNNDSELFAKLLEKPFVKYHGTMGKEDLIHIYRENDVFVMPSITETFGLVYAEAMSQGVPIIYTMGQGFDEQFSEGTVGYHVNPNDESDIASKIEMILNNRKELSENCMKNVEKFNWDTIANTYMKIYSEIGGQVKNENQ